ncbi:putative cellulase [Kockovaella imperatae]|uniref:glucan 1,3-beta-glucosidase n=1 Tax=Kockovaella imperatae TaxID=4999 RepID=A0A1Y1UKA9_9TREE|nr:putative cellulase [Kockovaella imperatae]ORX38488.1 putative cellulase [Kockovaella imperatae]
MMSPLAIFALLTTLVPSVISAPALHARGVNVGWPYGSEKIRGINIGGWLVLEPWITPSLFAATGNDAIVDEWTFCSMQKYQTASAALKQHWDTWYTESDFQAIAAAGLNHVRIPIGFWAYDISGGEPYIQGAAAYLDNAIQWARQNNLKVQIDLHGAPGSQNGYDNSGHRGDADWADASNNIARTKAILGQLSLKYSDPSYYQVVTMLEALNEPAGYLNSNLLNAYHQFGYDAYGAIRYPFGNSDESGLVVVLHDAFQAPSYFDNYMPSPQWQDVILDHHTYTIFDNNQVAQSPNQRFQQICNQASSMTSSPLWYVVGEWSLASTDCAPAINGRGVGARYDGTYPGSSYVGSCNGKSGNGSDFTHEYKVFLRKFWEVQTQVYENNGQGYIYWPWKAEDAADWSYQDGLAGGWIPQDPTQHIYSLDELCQ